MLPLTSSRSHRKQQLAVLVIFFLQIALYGLSSSNEKRIYSGRKQATKGQLQTSNNKEEKSKKNDGKHYYVAIIIDDIGDDMTDFTELMNIPYPLTISILPNQRFSGICDDIADHKGHEVMLHQPMEPRNSKAYYLGPEGIRTGMNKSEIESILESNLRGLDHVKGVNNHMGSMATTKLELMIPVMQYLLKKKLFFVDSVTIGSSIAYKEAKKAGVPTLERDLFIDAENGYHYAREQLKKLIPITRRKGHAIAIGHQKKPTIKALLEMLPILEDNNIEFCKVSELIKNARSN